MDTDIILYKEEIIREGVRRTYVHMSEVRRAYVHVSEVETGTIVILRENGRCGLNAQFTILDWPSWMPKTDVLFNYRVHTALNWATVEFYMNQLLQKFYKIKEG